jgi:transposase
MPQTTSTKKVPKQAPTVKYFCGFDWARHDHYFVLKDSTHTPLDEGYFANSAEGFQDFVTRLDAKRQGQPIALIIEATRGSATNVLARIEWITLYPVNPAKTRQLIELDGSGKGKNDPRDSHLLCDYLISNHTKLRTEQQRDENILCLQELVLTENEYIGEQTRLKNRIKALIAQFCPDLEAMVGEKLEIKAYTQYLLVFDPRQPAKDELVEEHLSLHHVRGKSVISAFLEKHRCLQLLPIGTKLITVHLEKLRALVRQLHTLQEELDRCETEITAYFNEFPNAEIYRSMPGLGERLAPRMAALFGKDPAKTFANKAEACAYFGQSPVTHSSGGYEKKAGQPRKRPPSRESVKKRRSCNRQARHAAYLWARSVNCLKEAHVPWQRAYLNRLKDRGDKVATRYRKLGRKMIAVLYTCLVTEQTYSFETYQSNLITT